MRAIRIHQYGDASVLRFEEVAVPAIRQDEALVKLHAAGVNLSIGRFERAICVRGGRPVFRPLKAIIEKEYFFAEAAAALAHSETGLSRGKIILRVV